MAAARSSKAPMAETELSVVCKNCGAEVSPYVTECPYCGTRLRKRAPKLERHGDELQARETRRARRRRRAAERRERASRLAFLATERPYVTLAAILGPAALLVVQRAADLSLLDLGVIDGGGGQHRLVAVPRRPVRLRRPRLPVRDRRWRWRSSSPTSSGASARCATLILLIACGALGALAAAGARRGPRRRRHADGRRQRDRAGRASAPGGSCTAPMPATIRPRSTTGSRWRSPPRCCCCCPWWRTWPIRGRGSSGGLVGLACGFSATLGRRSSATDARRRCRASSPP